MVSHRNEESSKKSRNSVKLLCLSSRSKGYLQRRFLSVFVDSRKKLREKSCTGLAGLKAVCVRIWRGKKRGKARKKVKKVKEKFMEVWQKFVFPVRRVWFAVSSRVKARKNGAGLLKLHNDIQTCGYQDVQVMWEMLKRSESELMANHSKRKHRSFWRVSLWSNHCSASPLSAKHT